MHRVAAAFAIILLDLSARAGLDKMLARAGSPEIVALWAQLQSVVDLVTGVALAGVMQGLTVLVAQARDTNDQRMLLGAALRMGMGVCAAVALAIAIAVSVFPGSFPAGSLSPDLLWLAALSGCATIIPATLNAYWLGRGRQNRMLLLTLVTSAVLLLIAAGAAFGLSLRELMLLQCVSLAVVSMPVWRYLRGLAPYGDGETEQARHVRRLARFIPVGLTIGIMSPVSMLAMRGVLSSALSWEDVGHFQALWRSAEWVTAMASGMFSLIFLPRLSAKFGSPAFREEMLRAGIAVLIPAALLLLLGWFYQRPVLAALYDSRFEVSDATAALFLLGTWMRIASWLFLYGLFAARATVMIIAGEFLSLPLYAFLLWRFDQGMTLERAALFYLVSYFIYMLFNLIGLLAASPRKIG
jgi:O-antigen/teichoic acid export membrane protein